MTMQIGAFHGDYSKPGEFDIAIIPTSEIPPWLADRFRMQ